MTDPARLRVVAHVVELYDDRERPVSAEDLVDRLDNDLDEIQTCLDELVSYDLLAPVEGGYRPTITARELLELGFDEDELVIIEPHDD